MASIHRQARIEASAAQLWDAIRDVGAIHTRLAPGFVTDVKLEPGARVVTFANGLVARELIVDLDDQRRRLAWSVVGSSAMTHHNASLQVFDEPDGSARAVWIADVLPNEIAPRIAAMIEMGLQAMQRAQQPTTARESSAARSPAAP